MLCIQKWQLWETDVEFNIVLVSVNDNYKVVIFSWEKLEQLMRLGVQERGVSN